MHVFDQGEKFSNQNCISILYCLINMFVFWGDREGNPDSCIHEYSQKWEDLSGEGIVWKKI